MKKLLAILLALIMVLSMVACGAKEEPAAPAEKPAEAPAEKPADAPAEEPAEAPAELKEITISGQAAAHTLIAYIAQQEGIFEKYGLDVEMIYFTSGATQTEALGADEWVLGTMGTPPTISGGIAYDLNVVALSVEDTVAVGFFVRPDSDIALEGKGNIEGYPEIYGSADTWRGKTILVPTMTSWHFVLVSTLATMGLTEEDVNIVEMDAASAWTAFQAGEGDVCCAGFPQIVQGEELGLVIATIGTAQDNLMPTTVTASETCIAEDPETIMNYLRAYFDVVEKYEGNWDALTDYLVQMNAENGKEVDREDAKAYLMLHELPSLEYAYEMFSGEYGSRKIDAVFEAIVDYFINQGRYTEEDKAYLWENNYVNGDFILQLCEERGIGG